MTDQTEIRVIELREAFHIGEDKKVESYVHAIQYRNDTTNGLWKSLPVIKIHNDREKYERMHGGADD